MSNNKDLDKFVRNLFGGNKKKPIDETPVDESKSESPQPKKTIVPKNKKPINMKQWTAAITTAGIILVVLVIALANVYIVKENEYRIVRQFGEVVKYESDPGIYMKIPFIQSVDNITEKLKDV